MAQRDRSLLGTGQYCPARVGVLLGIALLIAGCATASGPGTGKLYGLEEWDILEAIRSGEARKALTTLWKVDDRASYHLMREFYEHLETLGPAAALRQAQRATMQDFPHPFAWAAFGLTGVPK